MLEIIFTVAKFLLSVFLPIVLIDGVNEILIKITILRIERKYLKKVQKESAERSKENEQHNA